MILDLNEAIESDTKKLLERYNQHDIYTYYLEEPYTGPANKYKSTIRPSYNLDKDPSLTFMIEESGSMVYSDWGLAKHGNCIDYAREYYKVRGITFSSLKELLKQIESDLDSLKLKTEIIPYLSKKRSIGYTIEPFGANDIRFWNQFHISISTLLRFNIKRVNNVFDKDSEIVQFYYRNNNPIYAYTRLGNFGESFQLYRPLAERDRKFRNNFQKNDDILFGYNQLTDEGDVLFITKSMKDVMSIAEEGYQVVGTPSEGYKINEFHIQDLKNRFERIIILYDNDTTGLDEGIKLAGRHGLENKFIPLEYCVKDYADLRKNDIITAKSFLKSLI